MLHEDDSYMGSGKHLLRAINKYGLESFIRTILYEFDTPEEMYAKEAEIVDKVFCQRSDTYNIKCGGWGGWDHVDNTGKTFSKETRQKMSIKARKRQLGKGNTFYGKTHTEETKKLIGQSSKKRAARIYKQRMADGNHPNSVAACPHCGKEGQYRAMKRWHFDNCTQSLPSGKSTSI